MPAWGRAGFPVEQIIQGKFPLEGYPDKGGFGHAAAFGSPVEAGVLGGGEGDLDFPGPLVLR